ncbi:hypothetical protein [Mycobacterium sp. URHB0021]
MTDPVCAQDRPQNLTFHVAAGTGCVDDGSRQGSHGADAQVDRIVRVVLDRPNPFGVHGWASLIRMEMPREIRELCVFRARQGSPAGAWHPAVVHDTFWMA